MLQEIHIQYGDVDRTLNGLREAAQALDSALPTSVASRNVLELKEQLNQLNQEFKQLSETYQALVLKNEQDTRRSVDSMKETDERLSSSIRAR